MPAAQVYDPKRNPRGVRCSASDYLVNIVGTRAPASWGAVEREIKQGFANRFLDNVGVQYGLAELNTGQITPEQFIDLNAHVGGLDIDGNWQPQRMAADLPALEAMYRSGQIVQGRPLDSVAIIEYRASDTYDVHDNRQASYARERIAKANGNTRNYVRWTEPITQFDGLPTMPQRSFDILDQWLAAAEADTSGASYADRLAANRPAAAADECSLFGARLDDQICASLFTLPSDPRLEAGAQPTRDVLKCAIAPLDRASYGVTFTDGQWLRLQGVFPTGVCDWTKPGIGQQPSVPWLTYAEGPGGRPLGQAPTSRARR